VTPYTQQCNALKQLHCLKHGPVLVQPCLSKDGTLCGVPLKTATP